MGGGGGGLCFKTWGKGEVGLRYISNDDKEKKIVLT